jgi:hypothetical protein
MGEHWAVYVDDTLVNHYRREGRAIVRAAQLNDLAIADGLGVRARVVALPSEEVGRDWGAVFDAVLIYAMLGGCLVPVGALIWLVVT